MIACFLDVRCVVVDMQYIYIIPSFIILSLFQLPFTLFRSINTVVDICYLYKYLPHIIDDNHNFMNKILYLLIIAICLNLAHNQDIYSSTFARPITGTVHNIEYSPDQKYIVVCTNTQVAIHDGVTAMPKYYVTYPNGYTYNAFSFSQDSATFAVGFSLADGTTAIRIYTVLKGVELMKLQMPNQQNAATQVTSLCFTADNKRLVYSVSSGDIWSYTFVDKTYKSVKFDTVAVSTVACSPRRSQQFIAGGSNPTDGKQSKLKLYNIDPISNVIVSPAIHDFVIADPDETISALVYSESGTHIYRCGSKQVYKTSVDAHDEQVIIPAKEDLKDFVKIRVSADEKVVGVSTKNKQLHLLKYTPDANAQVQQTVTMFSTQFGLSSNSLNIMYMSSATSAQLSSQCTTTQILDANGVCVNCDPNCIMCLGTPTTCRSCKLATYLSETNKCESCIERCDACLNGNSCVACATPFVLRADRSCGCVDGKFVNENVCSSCLANCKTCTSTKTCSKCFSGYFAEANVCKTCAEGCLECSDLKTCTSCSDDYSLENGVCSSGFPTWAVILLVVLALSVVIIIFGVVYIKMRKQKRSPLLTDSDEAASNIE